MPDEAQLFPDSAIHGLVPWMDPARKVVIHQREEVDRDHVDLKAMRFTNRILHVATVEDATSGEVLAVCSDTSSAVVSDWVIGVREARAKAASGTFAS